MIGPSTVDRRPSTVDRCSSCQPPAVDVSPARRGGSMPGTRTPGMHGDLADIEALYKDVHRHPELSMPEERTAALAAQHLQAAGFEVTTGVGHTGVVGVLHNGHGPTVMLRADMDALPVEEQT